MLTNLYQDEKILELCPEISRAHLSAEFKEEQHAHSCPCRLQHTSGLDTVIGTFGAALLLDGCPDSGLCIMREPQPPDFIKAFEYKSGLQVSPGYARRAPLVRTTANVVACLSDHTDKSHALQPPQHSCPATA